MLESVNNNQLSLLKLMNSEDPSEARRLINLAIDGHPEINAFAYATGTLNEVGINDSRNQADVYCIRAVRNLGYGVTRLRGHHGYGVTV